MRVSESHSWLAKMISVHSISILNSIVSVKLVPFSRIQFITVVQVFNTLQVCSRGKTFQVMQTKVPQEVQDLTHHRCVAQVKLLRQGKPGYLKRFISQHATLTCTIDCKFYLLLLMKQNFLENFSVTRFSFGCEELQIQTYVRRFQTLSIGGSLAFYSDKE